MITIRDISRDLLNIIRGSNISQSEPISERQLYNWINQYRALLLKQSLDKKGVNPNVDYLQELEALQLTQESSRKAVIELNSRFEDTPGLYVYSTVELPNFLTLKSGKAITYVGTADGDEIQYMSKQRSMWQKYSKYAKNEPIVYDQGNVLKVTGDPFMSYITVRGVFEDPLEVMSFLGLDPLTTEYPIPYNIIPTLKEMILKKELNIEAHAPTDTSNDSEHDIKRVGNE